MKKWRYYTSLLFLELILQMGCMGYPRVKFKLVNQIADSDFFHLWQLKASMALFETCVISLWGSGIICCWNYIHQLWEPHKIVIGFNEYNRTWSSLLNAFFPLQWECIVLLLSVLPVSDYVQVDLILFQKHLLTLRFLFLVKWWIVGW